MNRNKIRVGVIGVGYLGKFHLEKYKMNKSVNLTSIADINNDNLDSIKYSRGKPIKNPSDSTSPLCTKIFDTFKERVRCQNSKFES